MRFGLGMVVALLVGCARLDKPALESYDDIRPLIAVSTDPQTGATTANSAAASEQEIGSRMIIERASDQFDLSTESAAITKRSHETAYVEAVRSGTGDTQVYIVSLETHSVGASAKSERPWTVTDPDRHGFIGTPWRRADMELVELSYDCAGQSITCTRRSIDRMVLKADDVRALLASEQDDIPVNFDSWKTAAWRIDKDALLAVLDALGVRDRFQRAS